jgi:hypothetical protein
MRRIDRKTHASASVTRTSTPRTTSARFVEPNRPRRQPFALSSPRWTFSLLPASHLLSVSRWRGKAECSANCLLVTSSSSVCHRRRLGVALPPTCSGPDNRRDPRSMQPRRPGADRRRKDGSGILPAAVARRDRKSPVGLGSVRLVDLVPSSSLASTV